MAPYLINPAKLDTPANAGLRKENKYDFEH